MENWFTFFGGKMESRNQTIKDKEIRILAIESSCDETAVAVVEDGRKVLSDAISSQVDIHALYGGVVPEIASRKHTEVIAALTEQALKEANCTREDIDALANDAFNDACRPGNPIETSVEEIKALYRSLM